MIRTAAVSTKKRVLIVEDDPDILSSLRTCLEVRHDVIVAQNGAEALQKVLAPDSGFGVIILDLMMPVMSGDALLRELGARGIGVPTIILSAGVNLAARA